MKMGDIRVKKFIVSGNSMYPQLKPGDAVLVIDDNYKTGDVVCSFSKCNSFPVIHRVYAIYQDYVFTAGDNRMLLDAAIKKKQISGKVKIVDDKNNLSGIKNFSRSFFRKIVLKVHLFFKIFSKTLFF